MNTIQEEDPSVNEQRQTDLDNRSQLNEPQETELQNEKNIGGLYQTKSPTLQPTFKSKFNPLSVFQIHQDGISPILMHPDTFKNSIMMSQNLHKLGNNASVPLVLSPSYNKYVVFNNLKQYGPQDHPPLSKNQSVNQTFNAVSNFTPNFSQELLHKSNSTAANINHSLIKVDKPRASISLSQDSFTNESPGIFMKVRSPQTIPHASNKQSSGFSI